MATVANGLPGWWLLFIHFLSSPHSKSLHVESAHVILGGVPTCWYFIAIHFGWLSGSTNTNKHQQLDKTFSDRQRIVPLLVPAPYLEPADMITLKNRSVQELTIWFPAGTEWNLFLSKWTMMTWADITRLIQVRSRRINKPRKCVWKIGKKPSEENHAVVNRRRQNIWLWFGRPKISSRRETAALHVNYMLNWLLSCGLFLWQSNGPCRQRIMG